MVREFGLSAELGPVGYPLGGSAFLGEGGAEFTSRPFAERTQAVIDVEVARLLREAEHRATAILTDHRPVLDELIALLLAEETVDGAVVYRLAGRAEPKSGAARTVAPERADARRQVPAGGAPGGDGDATRPAP